MSENITLIVYIMKDGKTKTPTKETLKFELTNEEAMKIGKAADVNNVEELRKCFVEVQDVNGNKLNLDLDEVEGFEFR